MSSNDGDSGCKCDIIFPFFFFWSRYEISVASENNRCEIATKVSQRINLNVAIATPFSLIARKNETEIAMENECVLVLHRTHSANR